MMKKTKTLFLFGAIAVMSFLVIFFALNFFISSAKAIEVIDPWDFCEKGEDCLDPNDKSVDDEPKEVCFDPHEYKPLQGCASENQIFGDVYTPYSNIECCPGLARVNMRVSEKIQPLQYPIYVPHEYSQCISCEICQDKCQNLEQKYDSDENAYQKCSQCLNDTISASLCEECKKGDVSWGGNSCKGIQIIKEEVHSEKCFECLGRSISFTGNKLGDYFANVSDFDIYDSLNSDYSRASCSDLKPVFRCSSGNEEDCKNDNPCSYPKSSVNSSGVSIRSSSKNESQLRGALNDALGKLGPGLGNHLNKLEGLNDKEFKNLLKKLNPDLTKVEIDGTSAFSTVGDNGENITIVNEDHWAVKKEGELANILAHEISHFYLQHLKNNSGFTSAWFGAAGDVYDSNLDGKSTWPDGSKSKNGCVNTYACTDPNEDVTETLRRAVKDPANFKSLFLNPGGQYYDARFKAKLELLARFGFITNAQLNAILCVGK